MGAHTKLEHPENSDPEALKPHTAGQRILPEQINGNPKSNLSVIWPFAK